MNKLKLLCALLIILASLVSFSECSRKVKTSPLPEVEPPANVQPEKISIPPETLKRFNISSFQVSEHDLLKTIQFPVTINREEGNITEIRAVFPGKVETVLADSINANVKIGQPLFAISSPVLLKLQENYLSATAASDAGVYRQQLLDYGFDPLDLENLAQTKRPYSTFTFYSKLNGIIKSKKAVPGLNVQPDTVLFTISDVSDGIAVGEISDEDANYIHLGMHGRMTINQLPGQVFEGQIFSIEESGLLNSNTRVKLIFRNLPQIPRLDKLGTLTILLSLGSYPSIPKTAVFTKGKQRFVLVPLTGGEFEQREIKVGLQSDQYVQILSGIQEGDFVVSNPELLVK